MMKKSVRITKRLDYNTIQHNTTQHSTSQHNTTQHNTTHHITSHHNTISYQIKSNTVQYNSTFRLIIKTFPQNRTEQNTKIPFSQYQSSEGATHEHTLHTQCSCTYTVHTQYVHSTYLYVGPFSFAFKSENFSSYISSLPPIAALSADSFSFSC